MSDAGPAPVSLAVPVLALSGPVGVGTTSVLVEMHDILCGLSMPHACVELDALAYSWPTHGDFNREVAYRNLAAVWATFRAAGATRLAVAGVVERASDLDGYRGAIPDAAITVCRLTAPEATRLARLRERERGAGLQWHLDRTVELERILDAVRLEDFVVENGDRPLRDVAAEVLARAGWVARTS